MKLIHFFSNFYCMSCITIMKKNGAITTKECLMITPT